MSKSRVKTPKDNGSNKATVRVKLYKTSFMLCSHQKQSEISPRVSRTSLTAGSFVYNRV